LCLHACILAEYAEVLRRPRFQFDEELLANLLDFIEYNSITVVSVTLSDSLPDPDDEPFLEIACCGSAECLVAGNQAHFPPPPCQGIEVLDPSEFIKACRKQQRKKRKEA